MTRELKRRVQALETAKNVHPNADAHAWLAWHRNGRLGPEPLGREAADWLMLQALLELSDEDECSVAIELDDTTGGDAISLAAQ